MAAPSRAPSAPASGHLENRIPANAAAGRSRR
uniref:Uncharacterized protein n=1 Tax=Myoviridae sp. ctPkm1 TaxID=2825099 RepID=A0A8S5TYB8_9CAUD|nr:MAG TPA: hypothetical protein [Myoviridae sp. ctPkm1]